MIKSAGIYQFKNDNKIIIYPVMQVKDWSGLPSPPYLINYDLSFEEILDELLFVLDLSKEVERPADKKESQKDFLKALGLKTFKALHDNSISLSIYLKDELISFCPTINLGSMKGYHLLPLTQRVVIPFVAPKKVMADALEIALSRCQ